MAASNWIGRWTARSREIANAVAHRARWAVCDGAARRWLPCGACAVCAAVFALVGLPVLAAGFAGVGVSLGAVAGSRQVRRWLGGARVETAHNATASASVADVASISDALEALEDRRWILSDSEARYRDLLDRQTAAIVRRDLDGRIKFANPAYCATFGVAREAILETTFAPRLIEDRQMPVGRQGDLLQKLATADGPRWFSWSVQDVPELPGGKPERQYVGRDVTAELRHEAQMREAREAAEAASRAKSRFLAAMSHEIRTPMGGVIGVANLLARTPLDREQRTYVQAISSSADNLKRLIDEILDFSKIEAGRITLHREQFALLDTVHDAIALVHPKAVQKGVSLSWSAGAGVPLKVVGDRSRLRQIVINLADNAVKFTPSGGVHVDLALAEGAVSNAGSAMVCVRLRVRDTGPGIAEGDADRLFIEFERAADIERQKADAGTGLGLAIVRELARAMGGEARAFNNENGGAVFEVDLMVEDCPDGGRFGDREGARCGVGGRSEGAHVVIDLACPLEAAAYNDTLRAAGLQVQLADRVRAGGDQANAKRARYVTLVERQGESEAGLRPEILLTEVGWAGRAEERQLLERPLHPSALAEAVRSGLHGPGEDAIGAEQAGSMISEGEADRPPSWTRLHNDALRVLVVEDNPVNALVAKTVLSKSGCDVVHVEDGAAGVAAASAALRPGARDDALFDLILMDLRMPGIDGYEALGQIRARYRQAAMADRMPPVIALTANAFKDDRVRCLETGFSDYLAKPFEPDVLIALVARWARHTDILRGDAAEAG